MAVRLPPGGEHLRDTSQWDLCAPFMTQLPISGALLSIVDRSSHRAIVAATDPVAARWDELEFELGAGPMVTAMAESAPQLLADVSTSGVNSILGVHLHELGVRALFAFPLIMGAATVGVAGLYRTTVGGLPAESLETALALARSATIPAVREALRLAEQDHDPSRDDTTPGLRREVHQATGMLSAQLDVSTTESFARLRAFALATNRSISDVSRDVVEGTLDFLDLE